MSNDTITLDWFQPDERNEKREDSCWYTHTGSGHDLIVIVSRGDRSISVYADGEMDIRVYEKHGDRFQEIGSIRYFEDLLDYNIKTDDDLWGLAHQDGEYDMKGPNRNGYYFQFVHNSWFDLYGGNDDNHLDCVHDALSDAIAQATTIINDDTDEAWQ